MGGDLGSRLCVLACQKFASEYPQSVLTMVGDVDEILSNFPSYSKPTLNATSIQLSANLYCTHAPDVVAMDAKPSAVLRKKAPTSMLFALDAVLKKEADACVSAGNTGALMALGCHVLSRVEGVERPAIVKSIPTVEGQCVMLDLGANVDCSSDQLVTFALMGDAMAKASGNSSPRVALLSNGTELSKGNKATQETAKKLEALTHVNFVGFIEGDALFNHPVDVVICDGFTGNIALKVGEGASRFIAKDLIARIKSSFLLSIFAKLTSPLLLPWVKKFRPERYNGAVFLGLNGLVIKSHGSATQEGFYCAIEAAYEYAQQNIVSNLGEAMAHAGLKN